MGYASQNPGEYQAFKIFQEDCAKTIKEIKKEEKKRTVIVILKVLSCVSLLPIPIYLTLYFAKRTYSNKQTRKTLMAALQAD
jgi:flagellar basal body-associated protein FliL